VGDRALGTRLKPSRRGRFAISTHCVKKALDTDLATKLTKAAEDAVLGLVGLGYAQPQAAVTRISTSLDRRPRPSFAPA
jgi:hypothetical protein